MFSFFSWSWSWLEVDWLWLYDPNWEKLLELQLHKFYFTLFNIKSDWVWFIEWRKFIIVNMKFFYVIRRRSLHLLAYSTSSRFDADCCWTLSPQTSNYNGFFVSSAFWLSLPFLPTYSSIRSPLVRYLRFQFNVHLNYGFVSRMRIWVRLNHC